MRAGISLRISLVTLSRLSPAVNGAAQIPLVNSIIFYNLWRDLRRSDPPAYGFGDLAKVLRMSEITLFYSAVSRECGLHKE